MQNGILIVDYGSQYTQLIARNVRELGVNFKIKPFNKVSVSFLKDFNPSAIILSGSPKSVTKKEFPKLPNILIEKKIPILGICYGLQIITKTLGGKIKKSQNREYGYSKINIKSNSKILPKKWIKDKKADVWMSHGDHVEKIPNGFKIIAVSSNNIISIIENSKRKIYGLQFHPEVVHTVYGKDLIKNFLSISRVKKNWNLENFINKKIQQLKKEISNFNIVCGLSGGIDSSVTAYLIHKAVKNKLYCIFVDNGLLRKGEVEEVKHYFRKKFKNNFIHVNASKIFLQKLKGIKDPEKKRKIIGKTFISIFNKEAKKIKNVKYLAQGTLYPDIIESLSFYGGPSSKIKSHHNVGGLPKKMKLKIIEPLKELFKDEVRELAKKLNMHNYIINRHPFPGPGLAIRIPGSIDRNKINILQQIDQIYINFLKEKNLYNKIWQAFAILLPIKTVGVMGDERTYNYACVLRAVTSEDGMTANFFLFSKSDFTEISTRIINNVKGVNRVLFDFTSKPPGTIEWE